MTTTTKPETTLAEKIRFQVDFMVMMLHVSRFEEADQAVRRIHVLLDEMEHDDDAMDFDPDARQF